MKRLFSDKAKSRFFQNCRIFILIEDPPGQTPGHDRGAKTRPQGHIECANPRGGGWSGLDGLIH